MKSFNNITFNKIVKNNLIVIDEYYLMKFAGIKYLNRFKR